MGFITDDQEVIGANIFSQVVGTETRCYAVNTPDNKAVGGKENEQGEQITH